MFGERIIIQQEREMYQDDPDSSCSLKLLQMLYPERESFSFGCVGTENSIEDIRLEDLRDNFENFTHHNNSHIFLVGNFDLELIQIISCKGCWSL